MTVFRLLVYWQVRQCFVGFGDFSDIVLHHQLLATSGNGHRNHNGHGSTSFLAASTLAEVNINIDMTSTLSRYLILIIVHSLQSIVIVL